MALPQLRAAEKFQAGIPCPKAKAKRARVALKLTSPEPSETSKRQDLLAEIAKQEREKMQAEAVAFKLDDFAKMLRDMPPFAMDHIRPDMFMRGMDPRRVEMEVHHFRLWDGRQRAFSRRDIKHMGTRDMHLMFRDFADGREVDRFGQLRQRIRREADDRWAPMRAEMQGRRADMLVMDEVRPVEWKRHAVAAPLPDVWVEPPTPSFDDGTTLEVAKEDFAAVRTIGAHLFKRVRGNLGHGHISSYKPYAPLKSSMEAMGWTFSGEGHFSAAWVKGNYAIKINFREGDTAHEYARFAKEHQGRPGCPDVYEVEGDGQGFMVLMRRYKAFEKHRDTGNLHNVWQDCRGALHSGALPRTPEGEFAALVRARFTRHSKDLHEGNVMVTEQGTLVMTDPICFST